MIVSLLLFNSANGVSENNAMQNVYISNRPPHLDGLFECTPPYTDCPQSPASLGVHTFPTLLFLGKASTGRYVEVHRMSSNISETAIRQRLALLQHAPSPIIGDGGYIPGDGDPDNPRAGYGLAEEILAALRDLFTSKPILIAGAALSTYQLTKARNTIGKVVWGGSTAFFGNELLKKNETANIGKIYDNYRIKPGSRVDQY